MKSAVIRPWRRSDVDLLATAELSERTLWLRFGAGMPKLPASYLRLIRTRWPVLWDAVIATRDGRLLGWAEYGRNTNQLDRADVAVCVIDAEQGQGLGTALLATLVTRAEAAGLHSVHADMRSTNLAANTAWRTVTGARAATFAFAS
jgi:L-amino acid N-acyltransferase YncA